MIKHCVASVVFIPMFWLRGDARRKQGKRWNHDGVFARRPKIQRPSGPMAPDRPGRRWAL